MPQAMKLIHLNWNEVIFINGYRAKVSPCKRGGVNLRVDKDCPISTETVEVVDLREPSVAESIVSGLKEFADDLESGKPIKVTRVFRDGRTEKRLLKTKAKR